MQSLTRFPRGARPTRYYSSTASSPGSNPTPSRHALWYRNILPAWMPIIVIGSGVYLALQMTRAHLAHQRFLIEARSRLEELEEELKARRSAAAGPSEVLAATLPMLVNPSIAEQVPPAVSAAPSPSAESPKDQRSWWDWMLNR